MWSGPMGVGDGMTRYAHSSSKIAVALLALAAACGSGQIAPGSNSKFLRMQDPAELDSENGLISIGLDCLALDSTDPAPVTDDPGLLDPSLGGTTGYVGISSCGISSNGMPPSLLDINGLHPNSLTDDHFKKWFASDPQTANTLMKYLVKCSLPADLGMSFEYGGINYLWPGGLGLAPHWAEGESIPEDEQQLVSACLAAHANRYGAHVPISVLGRYADGSELPVTDDELSSFPETEGCFFGNAFRKDGLFSANDRPMALTDDESSLRACAMADRTGSGASSMCAPIVFAGNCRDLCTADPNNLYYLNCTVNGKTYRALSTRIRPNVDYTCGDGICQVTESCGSGTSWNNCSLDCGPCN
jgi:hypothetical protein